MEIMTVRGALWGLVAIGVLIAIVAALTGLLLIVSVVVALAVLNLVYLPKAARRLGIRAAWLALILMPCMVLVGLALAGYAGAAWAGGLWLAAIGGPWIIGRELFRRIRARIPSRAAYYDITRPTTRPAGRPLPPADGPGQGEYGL
jgi:hypothetical protein